MKAKTFELLARCVQEGVARGLRHARKHNDTPSDEHLTATVEQQVMLEICEWFSFEDEPT